MTEFGKSYDADIPPSRIPKNGNPIPAAHPLPGPEPVYPGKGKAKGRGKVRPIIPPPTYGKGYGRSGGIGIAPGRAGNDSSGSGGGIVIDQLLLSGDAQGGTDMLLLSGDAQSGGDVIKLSGAQ